MQDLQSNLDPVPVSREKTLALIGVSDHEAAHLRLIMRKAAPDLDHRWLWGEEGSADLLVIDAQTFAGQMARTRAQGAGMRHAIFSDERVDGDGLVLRRPLRLADVIALLNEAGGAVLHQPEIQANDAGFYTRDIGDDHGESIAPRPGPAFDGGQAVAGLDDMLRPQSLDARDALDRVQTRPPVIPAGTAATLSTTREAMQKPESMPPRKYATRSAMLADTTPHGLRAFMDGDLLGGPARYALPGSAPLVLDPKFRVAHAPAGLSALAPYCWRRWRPCDWQPLTSTELIEVRGSQRTFPYERLIWLDVLLHSDGKLAPHLDPGGTYRLAHWVQIDHDMSRYFRIASAMLQPMRLHEIAAASGAPMGDVFDVINAYDAVGLIEWEARARRDDGVRAPSLLDKLRNPFGKA